MLANAAGVAMTPVHYRGGAPALQDLIGGHVPASVNPISETLSFAKAGALRMLAVTGARRSPFLPDVPTMGEQGYDPVVEGWLGGSLAAGAHAARHGARAGRRDRRGGALARHGGGSRPVRQRADVPAAGPVCRDGAGRPGALGPGREGVGIRRRGLEHFMT